MSDLDSALQRITITLAATVDEHLYVEADGTLPAAGKPALGVACTAGKSGDDVAVAIYGVVPITAGGEVALGAALKVTAAGKVVTATTGKVTVARALEAAAEDGDIIRCLLIPN